MKTLEQYKELLTKFAYDGKGKFFHKLSAGSGSKGIRAGWVGPDGYRMIRSSKIDFLEHHVVFFAHNGYIPRTIDHLNNNKSDNKIENLRSPTSAKRSRNRGMSKTNTSGFKGVSWHAESQKWTARVGFEGKRIWCGHFDDKADAVEAVRNKMEYLRRKSFNQGGVM